MTRFLLIAGLLFTSFFPLSTYSSATVAKEWNETLLYSIRNSRARPTVHARNLYHWSLVAYDAWAAYEPGTKPYALGDTLEGYPIPFKGVPEPKDRLAAQQKAISYASYRLMMHRYQVSPKFQLIKQKLSRTMAKFGYPVNDTATTYWDGEPAHLGNYLAAQIIDYGLQDGANEANNYRNEAYVPLNDTLNISNKGTPGLRKPNHWQPLQITTRRDQAGNPIKATQSALSPEWGDVDPFAMEDSNYVRKTRKRTGKDYKVWLDPGPPPYLDTSNPSCLKSEYKWNFCMVSVWQSHLAPTDTTKWDISPGNLGNLQDYPDSFKNYDSFYNFFKGGGAGIGKGYDKNPVTGQPYQKQMVKRADYGRILAEYWADGIASETPPGHWFAIYNEIAPKPGFDKKWKGRQNLSDLAYDLQTYFALGGAMHDAAIAAWSVKGWYDYVRPVSAIRNMAKHGQCTDPNKRSFDSAGIPLIKDYIEVVQPGDPLAGQNNQHVGDIKLYTWKGPDYVNDPETDTAGVGWILAGNWWPYQKPSFVTPPFPGYVSGHSTYSQAAARILTQTTGSPYFPGGKSDFHFEANEFLDHENGPTEDVTLEYATYKDAADWTALSRIWGGIHPPADDINGRKMGRKVGNYAFKEADKLFKVDPPEIKRISASDSLIGKSAIGSKIRLSIIFDQPMKQAQNPDIEWLGQDPKASALKLIKQEWQNARTHQLTYQVQDTAIQLNDIHCQVDKHEAANGKLSLPYIAADPFVINTADPRLTSLKPAYEVVNDTLRASRLALRVVFNETMDTSKQPAIQLSKSKTLIPDYSKSMWLNRQVYRQSFYILESDEKPHSIDVQVKDVDDAFGNTIKPFDSANVLTVATTNPQLAEVEKSQQSLSLPDQGQQALEVDFTFSMEMDTTFKPQLGLPNNVSALEVNPAKTRWKNDSTYHLVYGLSNKGNGVQQMLDAGLASFSSAYGNPLEKTKIKDFLLLDTEMPEVIKAEASKPFIARQHIGSNEYNIRVTYNEAMNTGTKPFVTLNDGKGGSLEGIVKNDFFESTWVSDSIFKAAFKVVDTVVNLPHVTLTVNFGEDKEGNEQEQFRKSGFTTLDTESPEITSLTADRYQLTSLSKPLRLLAVFSEPMDTSRKPEYNFETGKLNDSLKASELSSSKWLSPSAYEAKFNLQAYDSTPQKLDVGVSGVKDKVGNQLDSFRKTGLLNLRLTGKEAISSASKPLVTVYPNPVQNGQDHVSIKISKPLSNARIVLKSLNGRVISRHTKGYLGKGPQTYQIPGDLAKGAYTLSISGQQRSHVLKLIKH